MQALDAEGWQVTPDDRQKQVETIGGMAVQDFGHVEAGDRISCEVTLTAEGWDRLAGYWNDRKLVDVTDAAGIVWREMRVVVKSYQYVSRFPKIRKVTLEFWRC